MSKRIMGSGARVAACVVLAAGALVVGGAGAASAESYETNWLGTQYTIVPTYDLMNVAVAQGAQYDGAQVIQWYNDGGSEQKWIFGDVYWGTTFEGFEIRNLNSGLCLDSDGRAGDGLYQWDCDPSAANELYTVTQNNLKADLFYNVGTGLYLDVSGYSYGAGAHLDLWYNNGQSNQQFFLDEV